MRNFFLKTLISFCLFCSFIFLAAAQGPGDNLIKYWKYRERLKNFVVVGDCQGCSCPAVGRSNASNLDPLEWSDATIEDGYYIGMLAMEYKLLKDHGYTAQLQETARELYYALEAINRLDLTAEFT